MTRGKLTEMIREAINELAFETLRGDGKKKTAIQPEKTKGLTEDELEYALFYGGNKPNKDGSMSRTIAIKESYNGGIPKINSSDITQFEDSFEMILQEIEGASIVFDKQSNGYSLKMWIGPNGIEAGASGTIEMGNRGVIKWAYSLQNGLTVTTQDFNVEKGNRNVLDKLYHNYNAWQKEWREKLTITPGESGGEDYLDVENPEAAPTPPAAAPAPE